MCIFQTKKFELYPEETQIHLGYKEPDESNKRWMRRAEVTRIVRNIQNQERNERGQIATCELAERKAAERKTSYQA